MYRALAAIAVLAVACAAGFAMPAGSGASTAAASAKSKCRHRHPHNHRRCRRKASGGSSSAGGGSAGAGSPTGPPGRLLATEREISPTQLRLQLSRPSLSAGAAIVEQYNAGSDPHNLVAERQGAVAFSFETLDPSGDQRQRVSLTRGTYTLYCSLLNHRDLGMQATLTVN